MQRILLWLSGSPLRSGPAVAALAVSRLFDILGAALLVMISMRKGWLAGLQAALPAFALVAAIALAAGMPVLLLQVAGLWIPVLLLGELLRRTGSLAMTLQAAALLPGVLACGWLLTGTEPLAAIEQFLQQSVLPMMAEMGQPRELTETQLAEMAKVLPGFLAAGAGLSLSLTMLLGRFWQAVAWNPGGFGQDYRELRIGRGHALLAGLLLGATGYVDVPLLTVVGLVMAVPLLLQGFAVLHCVVQRTKLSDAVLWGAYVALFLLPAVTILLMVAIGALDNWTDFRRRLPPAAGGPPSEGD